LREPDDASLATRAAPHRRVVLGERWLAAAAALVLVVIGIVALLVAQTHHHDRQSASPVGTPAAAASPAPGPRAVVVPPTTGTQQLSAGDVGSAASANGSAAADSSAAPVDVGDFGDLDRTPNLDRLRQALASATPTASNAGRGRALVTALAGRGCVGALPPGTITAVATGTLGREKSTVVLTVLADGSRSIDAVDGNSCTVRPLS
jgi:hypothetical protein